MQGTAVLGVVTIDWRFPDGRRMSAGRHDVLRLIRGECVCACVCMTQRRERWAAGCRRFTGNSGAGLDEK